MSSLTSWERSNGRNFIAKLSTKSLLANTEASGVGIVVELPEVDELIDHARVGLEVSDQLLVPAELRIQLHRLRHLAHMKA